MTLTNKAFGFTLEEPIEFIDIADSDWFAGAVRKAKAAGYIGGYPDGSMKPNNPISRQEAAVILSKIRGLAANLVISIILPMLPVFLTGARGR